MSASPFDQILLLVILLCLAAFSALDVMEVLGGVGITLSRQFRERAARLIALCREVEAEIHRWKNLFK